MSKEKILSQIRKLFEVNVDNGATESEMETAMKMAQKLMMKYQIDESELTIAKEDINILEVQNQFEGGESKYWLWTLLMVIGKCYQCKILRTKVSFINKKGRYDLTAIYKIVGETTDRILVKNIFDSLVPIIRNLYKSRYKEYKKSGGTKNSAIFSRSYIEGFLSGLDDKLKKDREEFLMNNSDKNKWGLILVKKDDLIKSYLEEQFPNLKEVKTTSVNLVLEAYFIGQKDGIQNDKKQLQ